MRSILTGCIRTDKEYAPLLETIGREWRAKKPKPILINGLPEGASTAMLVSLLEDLPTVYHAQDGEKAHHCAFLVCAEEKDCNRLTEELNRFGIRAAFFIGRDLNFHNVTASHEYEQERLDVLFRLLNDRLDVVLTTPDAALGYTVPPLRMAESTVVLDANKPVALDEIVRRLLDAGYCRTDMVDGKGQFAVRGGIVDICPPYGYYVDGDGGEQNGSMALRIELFGDEIDRMGLFDVDTQRLYTTVSRAQLPLAREILPTKERVEELRNVIKTHAKTRSNPAAEETLRRELATVENALANGSEIPFADKYITLFYPEKATVLDYADVKSPVILLGTNNINERLQAARWQSDQTVEELVGGGSVAPKYAEYGKPVAAFDAFLSGQLVLHLDSLSYGVSGQKLAGLFGFRAKQTVSYCDNTALLQEELSAYLRNRYRVILLVENDMAALNWQGMLREAGTPVQTDPEGRGELPPEGTVTVVSRAFLSGYELLLPRIVILSTCPDTRRGHPTTAGKLKKRKNKAGAREAILSYADLEVGQYVVHENYGIGIYTGIEKLTTAGVTRDYIGIRYDGTDKLYIPTEQLDRVSKYIGPQPDEAHIKLSKLTGDAWKKTKSRAMATVKDIAKQLIQLYAQRERRPGFSFPEDDEFQRNFDAAFEYEETECQLRAVEEVKRDMMRPVPMDRLLCGDVGFGKTEVALRAAYKAVLGGKQVAVLVPTTILALQHYQTFLSRMRAFGVHVDMISRFRTAKEQARTLREVARGETDVLIGTHRLLGKGIEFKNLGLLVVDEEQRFGVQQKEKLKMYTENIDVLSLSATPIPRTLNMTMGGLRDISVLDEAPGERLPVQTYVLEDDDVIIHEAVRKELRRGGQVFYLHNTIENIDLLAGKLRRALPDARIVVAHGQMEKDTLEDIWERMINGEIDILVCTTIIETGIDVPNANTLIVDCAHRLGLSQLHQLRGRVGRSSRRAYAYFTYPRGLALTDIARKRLEAIRDYAEFGAGFKIAMRDMEIRGAGNLLGAEQHGHLDAVGYDLYVKLLNEAVLTEKGMAPKPETECSVSLPYDAFIPEKYVAYSAQRMDLYKKIALIQTREDMADMTDELIDRYGDLPEPVVNLLHIALIHALGKACHFKQIQKSGNRVSVVPEKFDFERISAVSEAMPGTLVLSMGTEPFMQIKVPAGQEVLPFIQKVLEKYLEISQVSE